MRSSRHSLDHSSNHHNSPKHPVKSSKTQARSPSRSVSRSSSTSSHQHDSQSVKCRPKRPLLHVPRLSIAPMVDVSNVFFRLFNRIVSQNTTVYTEMIVDKQLLNSQPYTRVSIGVMHPTESTNYDSNMQRFYREQQHRVSPHQLVSKGTPDSPQGINLPINMTSFSHLLAQIKPQHRSESTHRVSDTTSSSICELPALSSTFSSEQGGGSVAQISGADAFELSAAAVMLQAMGYDAININMGCPASSAQNGLHGALMMVTPGVEEQIERLRSNPSVYIPITIKCRLNVNTDADYDWFKNWVCAYISQTGIAHYIVHARIAKLHFNPKRNLSVPPLHPEFIHYLQTDVREYLHFEKRKLYAIMEDWRNKNVNNDIEPPFGTTGRGKNSCMYYIDAQSGKKVYVPLHVCFEYNGGILTPQQAAEVTWALTPEGGFKLRPTIPDMSSTHTTALHCPAKSTRGDSLIDSKPNEPEQLQHVDVLESNQFDTTPTKHDSNEESSGRHRQLHDFSPRVPIIQSDQQLVQQNNLSQPLLPGLMVGRGDWHDIFFPLFYDAFYHALVLANNGQLDNIPNLLTSNTHITRPTTSFPTDNTPHPLNESAQDAFLVESAIEDGILTPSHDNLCALLHAHMDSDPIITNSGIYIDIETGEWVSQRKLRHDEQQQQEEEEETQQHSSKQHPDQLHRDKQQTISKPLSELSEQEKIGLIRAHPGHHFNVPSNPSRLDVLIAYLTEVDKLLFDPDYGYELQLAMDSELRNAATTSAAAVAASSPTSTPNNNQNSFISASAHSSDSDSQNTSHHPIAFSSSTLPPITPHESQRLLRDFSITQFDQQSLTTIVNNPLNPTMSLARQPYPYTTESSCSFATTVTPSASSAQLAGQLHPFVEHIVKVLISQEMLDMGMIMDSLNFHVERHLSALRSDAATQQPTKAKKPNANILYTTEKDTFDHIVQCKTHPFVDKVIQRCLLRERNAGLDLFDASTQQLRDVPLWIQDWDEYPSVATYRPFIHTVQQIASETASPEQFFATLAQKIHNRDPSVSVLFKDVKSRQKNLAIGTLRAKVSTWVAKLSRLSQSQGVSSALYGYLYGISDLFLRPLSTIFANTEGNDHWRKVIHTACLIAKANPAEVFETSSFWTHNNDKDSQVADLTRLTSKKRQYILEDIATSQDPAKLALLDDYVYIGDNGDLPAGARRPLNKSKIHNADGKSPADYSIPTQYQVDQLQYEASSMALYPKSLLDNDHHWNVDKSLLQSPWPNTTTNPASAIVPRDHPITAASETHVQESFSRHVLQKHDSFVQNVQRAGELYLSFNKQPIDRYLHNTAGFLDTFEELNAQRETERVSYIAARKQQIAELRAQGSPESLLDGVKAEPNTTPPKTVPQRRLSEDFRADLSTILNQKGGDYSHINIEPEYLLKRQRILNSCPRRVHAAFIQRFPFELTMLNTQTLQTMLDYVGGDINLYNSSPIRVLGLKRNGQNGEYRSAADLEIDAFASRHQVQATSWIYSVLHQQNILQSTSSPPPQPMSIDASSTQPDAPTAVSSSPADDHPQTITDMLQAVNIRDEIQDALPVFEELCHRFPILQEDHAYQYATAHRIALHSSLGYLRDQIRVIDSIALPPDLFELEPFDLMEARKSSSVGMSRDLLRQPLLDEGIRSRLYQNAQEILQHLQDHQSAH